MKKKTTKKASKAKKKTTRSTTTTKKKTAGKKKPAKKKVAKKKVTRKATKKTTKKSTAKKGPAVKKATKKKLAPKKPGKKKPEAKKKTAVKKKKTAAPKLKAAKSPAEEPKIPKKRRPKRRMSPKQKQRYRDLLISLRQKLSSQISVLKRDSLKRTDSVVSEEDGTDAFDRQFALNLASSENESLVEVDEALRRLDQGLYGVCDDCFVMVGEARLQALPFVRLCIKCQSEREKGKLRYTTAGIRHGY